MRLGGIILAGLVLLPVMQGAATLLVAVTFLVLIAFVLLAPRETLSVLFGLALLSAFSAYPLVGLLVMGILIWASRALRS